MSEPVVVAGTAMTRFGCFPDRSLRSLAQAAADACLLNAGQSVDQVDAVYSSNSMAGIITGQEAVRGQVALRGMGLDFKPFFNVENACASGSSALHLAATAIQAGIYERVLVVGFEKLTHESKQRTFDALAAACDLDELAAMEGGRSIFVDIYAAAAKRHMELYGATAHDYAWIAAKNHTHAVSNPRAQFRTSMTPEQVLSARTVVAPLTVPMCSPIGDGAAAVLLCRADLVPAAGARVEIIGSAIGSGAPTGADDPCVAAHHVAQRAYEQAGVDPLDIDLAEVHDATSPAELFAYESLGLCAVGDGRKLVAEEATQLGGRIPVNVSGGLVSKGHPVGASGIAQIVELTEQLLGRSGDRQVARPRLAVAHNGGGYIGGDVAAVGVHVLHRAGDR